MGFEIKDIPGINFQLLNNFFLTGFDSDKLVEQSQKISLPYVDIQTNDWYFDGIRMGYSNMNYKEAVGLKWNYDIKVELVTFMANIKGSILVGNHEDQPAQLPGNYQHNLFYSNGNESAEGILKSHNSQVSMFLIQFTKDAFLQITQGANEALNRFGENVVNGQPALLSMHNLPMDATMQNMISNIVNCRYKDGLKKMFLLSKSIEFLVIQAEACNAALAPSQNFIKTNYDKECIKYAREYIMNNLETPPGLSELAKIVGINEYKLKRGFKEIFGNTVFGYLSDARLEIAKNDLLESKKTVSGISSELGYSSVQHFSSAFKKKFGLSPNKLKH